MQNTRKTETRVYIVIWIAIFGLYLLDIMRGRAQTSQSLLDKEALFSMILRLLPMFSLFIVNNNLLMPRLMMKGRITAYFISVAVTIGIVWWFQIQRFEHFAAMLPERIIPPPHPEMRPLLPMPVMFDILYDLCVVGSNLAIALLFRRVEDRFEREQLLKANTESQLTYLRAQINPHFYMNMLNNIHGMIEIDAEKAQNMILDMSRLMRYSLYDSCKERIPLADEVTFISNYIRLMRQRYPQDKVTISFVTPEPEVMQGVMIPPMLLLVFIENAFKHGISYIADSLIAIKIEISDGVVMFTSINSCNHERNTSDGGGIGLQNVKQRLALLYGDKASMEISARDSIYDVTLKIPIEK